MDQGSRGLSCCQLHTMKTIAFAKHKAHWQLTLPVAGCCAGAIRRPSELHWSGLYTVFTVAAGLLWLRRWGKRGLAAGGCDGCDGLLVVVEGGNFLPMTCVTLWALLHCTVGLWGYRLTFDTLSTSTKTSFLVLFKLTMNTNYAWIWKLNAPNVQLEFQCAVPTLATCPPSSRVTAPGHQAAASREGNHETSHNPELDHWTNPVARFLAWDQRLFSIVS